MGAPWKPARTTIQGVLSAQPSLPDDRQLTLVFSIRFEIIRRDFWATAANTTVPLSAKQLPVEQDAFAQ
jgi:hypothetical protein